MHHACFNKQGLCVAKQSLLIMQTKAHSWKEFRYVNIINSGKMDKGSHPKKIIFLSDIVQEGGGGSTRIKKF